MDEDIVVNALVELKSDGSSRRDDIISVANAQTKVGKSNNGNQHIIPVGQHRVRDVTTNKRCVMHGRGKAVFKTGEVIIGDFFTGKVHGQAKIYYTNGTIAEGSFFADRLHGKGTRIWGGGVYSGQIFADVPHGQGKITFPDGSGFEGQFFAGKKHGPGKVILATGSSSEVKHGGEILVRQSEFIPIVSNQTK